MNVRRATPQDIPAIVELLKQSLGESLMPKSTEYWYWKHVNNPYGESPVLLAEDEGKIVGVRAFMRWQWKQGDQRFEAVRAVDTATHPNWQGKGIFSKLTKALLEECKTTGWDFVFNTPNEKSKPGYIKMGWEEAGKLPINIRIVRPIAMLFNALRKAGPAPALPDDGSVQRSLAHPGMPELIRQHDAQLGQRIQTVHSVDSLRWRYQDVPVEQYFAAADTSNGTLNSVFFYRIKTSRLGREFRITDIFLSSPKAAAGARKLVRAEVRKYNAHYVTLGSFASTNVLSGLVRNGATVGPIVTVRDINMGDSMRKLRSFTNWSPSLGDLELF